MSSSCPVTPSLHFHFREFQQGAGYRAPVICVSRLYQHNENQKIRMSSCYFSLSVRAQKPGATFFLANVARENSSSTKIYK
jgi:hypothetical protein